MALLTADDVLNKKFQPTKFREGYDQDEVDDFLDEVVNTLRVVGSENEELKAKLEAAERRVAELSSGGAPAAQDAAEAPAEQTAQFSPVTSQEDTSEVEETPTDQGEETAEADEAPATEQAPSSQEAGTTGGDEPASATGLLQLAQRLHDEYVCNRCASCSSQGADARARSEATTS